MYYQYFGFEKNPFDIHPDPDFLYLSDKHREALAHLKYSVIERKPFLLLVGDVGVGKTTLINFFLNDLKDRKDIVVLPILNPNLTLKEFYLLLARKLGLKSFRSKADFMEQFKVAVSRMINKGKIIVLLIDEAQSLSEKLLEELRLLSNLVQETAGFVVILVGQPDLYEKLKSKALYSLKQRFVFKYHLGPFDNINDVAQYLATRILKSGAGNTQLFSKEAVDAIFYFSKGIPRLINIIADHSLMNAYLKGVKLINRDIVCEAVKELDHIIPQDLVVGYCDKKFFQKKFVYLAVFFFLVLGILFFYYEFFIKH